uniref:Uncharacterized protein n=1 Tax=Amphora coffeiformis TaxID=265554 RepID=A0A7S3L008_9STRA|mmetsp:Transcript_5463/g.11172  ORF Transcript_5463/g.11172 Transcript_5463/m.11172 type:complete len:475 (-) Transcript_5463:122-1546(-)|eukprot:scaffold4232_cov215-Amphora_coffeaeformis.AAC.12
MPRLVPSRTQQVEQLIKLQPGGNDSISSHDSTQKTSSVVKRKKNLLSTRRATLDSSLHRVVVPNSNANTNNTATSKAKPQQSQGIVTGETAFKQNTSKNRRASLDSSENKQQQKPHKPTNGHVSRGHRRASLDSSLHQHQQQEQPRQFSDLIELVEQRLQNNKKASSEQSQKGGTKTTPRSNAPKKTINKQPPRRASLDSSLPKSPPPLVCTNKSLLRDSQTIAKKGSLLQKVQKTEQRKNEDCPSKQHDRNVTPKTSHPRSSLDSPNHQMEAQSRRSSLHSLVPDHVTTKSQRRFSLESAPPKYARHNKHSSVANGGSFNPTAAGPKRREVHFGNTQYVSDCNAISREEIHALWYKKSDFALFKQQAADHVQALTLYELQHGSYKSYAMALIRAYQGMEYAGTRIQAQSCLVNSKTAVTAVTVGMETSVVLSILNDWANKRTLVLKRLQELQNLDPATRAVKARLVSRAISRP